MNKSYVVKRRLTAKQAELVRKTEINGIEV